MSTHAVATGAPVLEPARGREFRPTSAEARSQFAVLLLAAGFWLLAGLFFWWAGGDVALVFFGIPTGLFAVQVLWHGVSGWQLRDTPLVIGPDGRVRYADRDVCPAGSVAAVRVVPDPLSEADGHRVMLLTDAGAAVGLPPPYFDSFPTRPDARRFADQLAAALGVPLGDPG